MPKKRVYLSKVGAEVPEEIRDAYNKKCEQIYGMKRQGHIPIRKFIHDFVKGRIYIVDGEIQIIPKK